MILSLAGQCTDSFARLEGEAVDQENPHCLLVMRKCNTAPNVLVFGQGQPKLPSELLRAEPKGKSCKVRFSSEGLMQPIASEIGPDRS